MPQNAALLARMLPSWATRTLVGVAGAGGGLIGAGGVVDAEVAPLLLAGDAALVL